MKLDAADSDFSPDDIDVDITLEDISVDYEPDAPVSPGIVEACEAVFAEEGMLAESARSEGRLYEYRPQQRAMALGVAEALRDGANLCVEAPTGVGKSFAYLVPLIYRAQTARRPAVVSTETITLQEQLIERDLPLLGRILGLKFKAVLAKGRRNYLCRRRFSLLSGAERDALLPTPSLVMDLARLEKFLNSGEGEGTRDGLGFSIDPTVWSMVCSEIGNC
ncbi:MAG: DEAD/DEAH box helicase, partial [Lentisphaeria bacterium]|nr:DEAD/DEAH box helicase [Lentisphaeria bacterium]